MNDSICGAHIELSTQYLRDLVEGMIDVADSNAINPGAKLLFGDCGMDTNLGIIAWDPPHEQLIDTGYVFTMETL